MSKFILVSNARVATAGGEAIFRAPAGDVLSNEIGRSWQNLPEGTVVELCAAFPGTHTFMVTISVPSTDDAPAQVRGAVLRQDSWDKVLGASQPFAQDESKEELVELSELAPGDLIALDDEQNPELDPELDALIQDMRENPSLEDYDDGEDEDEDEGPTDEELDALGLE